MKFVLIFTFVTCAFAHTIERSLLEEKIVGGTTATSGQFPYQISLKYYNRHNCGGSILDQNNILTAAHCVEKFPSEKSHILAGTNKLNQGGESYLISRYIIHENWNPVLASNDIAIVKVKTPIQFTTYIQPIAIDVNFIPADIECVFSGWGSTSYPGASSNELLYFNGHVVSLNSCQLILSENTYPVLNSHICAFAKRGIGACSGDSGGPLVSNNKQIGIFSWAPPCAFGVPDVHTRVSYYSVWITTQQAQPI